MRRDIGIELRAAARMLAAVVVLSAGGAAARAQSDTAIAGAGVATLTASTRQQAVECGDAGAACAVTPYELCPQLTDRYLVRLITPFSRVAAAELDAKRNQQPLGRMGPGAVNGWGVALYVVPAERSRAAEAVRRVEIRRNDGTVIQPRWTTMGPITTTIADGTTRSLSRGFFVFPVETFSPASDLTVVLVGQSGEATCAVDRSRLTQLR